MSSDVPEAFVPEAGSAVSEDAFLGGRLVLRQPKAGYRAGVDAVLLAATVPVGDDEVVRVLDAGAGVGAVGLCVAARCARAQVTLVEQAPELVALAQDNIVRNGLSVRVRSYCADVTERGAVLAEMGIVAASFDHALANPPFHRADAGTPAASPLKANAHAMEAELLERWGRFLAYVVKPGGTATVIHKTEALAELLTALDRRFGALRVLPVAPKPGAAAIRIIVQGIKGSRAPLSLLPPLVLHESSGAFTGQLTDILRNGAGLRLP